MSKKEDEISLREIILRLKSWYVYLKSKWLLLFIIGILGAAIGLLYAIFQKPKYTGELTFVLSSNSQSSGLVGLAGQFGLDIGTSNSDVFSGDNIVELFKSRRIMKGALFRYLPDSSQTLINYIIDTTGLQKKWLANERFQNLLPFPADVNKLTPIQDSLVSKVQGMLVESYLNIGKTDKKLSFYKVATTSPDEKTSYYLTSYLVDEASRFFIDTKTKSAKTNLAMLQKEADSLRNQLGGVITSAAAEADRTFNLNPSLQVQRSVAQQGQLKASVLGAAYGEVIKNLEIAKITLQKETPLFQIIDEPEFPLVRTKFGRLKGTVIGGFFAVFFVAAILLGRKILHEIIE